MASKARSVSRTPTTDRSVYVIVALGSNCFYTVTLPVTPWFLDRGNRGTDREDKVLFIDARKIFRQIDRAQRAWLPVSDAHGVRRALPGEDFTFIDQSKVPVARAALFAPGYDSCSPGQATPLRPIVGAPMQPMLRVTINATGIVFVTKINGHIDEELDTTDCAVRVLHAMQEHGTRTVSSTLVRLLPAEKVGGCGTPFPSGVMVRIPCI